jgi:FolB domain-containing protein
MDVVRIIGLELDCIVGIRAYERQREQRVRLDLDLSVDTRKAGRSGRINQTVDYDMVAHHVMAMLRFRRYQLIEMAAEELSAMLLSTQPELRQAQLRIEKPGALEGRAQAACVEVRRTAGDFEPTRRSMPWGIEREVLRTRDASLLVCEIAPGQSWSADHDTQTRCLMWPIRGQLLGAGSGSLDAAAVDTAPFGSASVGSPDPLGTVQLEMGQVADCEHNGDRRWVNDSPNAVQLFRCVVPPQASAEKASAETE